MLTVLYGPSCIGKTSIQKLLIDSRGFIAVRCFTTRELRKEGDPGRVHVDQQQFRTLRERGEFYISNLQFGEYYGASRIDIERAVASTEHHYVLDFRIRDRVQLEYVPHLRILVVVDDEQQLRRHIVSAGRTRREEEIIEEYRRHYSPGEMALLRASGFKIVKNRFGRLGDAASCVSQLSQVEGRQGRPKIRQKRPNWRS